MADQEYAHTNLSLVGRHTPESDADSPPDAHDVSDPKTGVYEIGVEIEGVFVPIFSERAGFIYSRIERAKAAREAEQANRPPEPTQPTQQPQPVEQTQQQPQPPEQTQQQ